LSAFSQKPKRVHGEGNAADVNVYAVACVHPAHANPVVGFVSPPSKGSTEHGIAGTGTSRRGPLSSSQKRDFGWGNDFSTVRLIFYRARVHVKATGTKQNCTDRSSRRITPTPKENRDQTIMIRGGHRRAGGLEGRMLEGRFTTHLVAKNHGE